MDLGGGGTRTEISTETDQRMDVLDLTQLKKYMYANKCSFSLIPQVFNFFKFYFTHVQSRPTGIFFFFLLF